MAFVGDAPESEDAQRLYDASVDGNGYVANYARLWAWRPDVDEAFRSAWAALREPSSLGERDFAVLVAATAAGLGDSYCALAWGTKLAALAGDEAAGSVIRGEGASERDEALGRWARKVVGDPNATTSADVQELRDAGLGDKEIFEATAFVAFRLAFSTVNDALGAAPDPELVKKAPEAVRDAVRFGRPPG